MFSSKDACLLSLIYRRIKKSSFIKACLCNRKLDLNLQQTFSLKINHYRFDDEYNETNIARTF